MGLLVGCAAAVVRTAETRPHPVAGAVGVGLLAMAGADVPMALLGVSDPRTWRARDWLADALPHLAYGAVVEYVLDSKRRGAAG